MAGEKERPILFSAPMVRAILAGNKTQTRRVVNLERLKIRLPYEVRSDLPHLMPTMRAPAGVYPAGSNPQGAISVRIDGELLGVKPGEFDFVCPYATGTTRLVDGGWRIEPHGSQRLWVREACCIGKGVGDVVYRDVVYRADDETAKRAWLSSIHMPRWACRLVLEVTDVRLQRLQDISEEDAKAEGAWLGTRPAPSTYPPRRTEHQHRVPETYREAFARAWGEINGAGSWDANPMVWVIEFKRLNPTPPPPSPR